MIILIGGPSNTGKTFLAQQLLERYKYPYYSMDHIKMGICRSDQDCGFTPMDEDTHIAKAIWPMIREIIKTAIENKQSLIVEGVYFLPEHTSEFEPEYREKIVPLFLAFTDQYVNDHYECCIVGRRSVIEEKECEDRPKETFLLAHRKTRKSCQIHHARMFLVDQDYEKTIQEAIAYIDRCKDEMELRRI